MNIYRPNSPQWMQAGGQNFSPSFSNGQFQQPQYRNIEQVITLVKQLTLSPSERSEALHTLSLHREQIPDLAVLLWESPGTITSLLFEILAIYPHLAATSSTSNNPPPSLNARLASRVCNVLALLQCVAGHDETRIPFIQANIPMYLFPFLHTTNTSRECECFKLTSLGILGSLVKAEQPDIIDYLLKNEFVPLCLRILKFGQEMSRIVAAFIVQKILSDINGRSHVCTSPERLETVLKVLNIVLYDLAINFSQRLAKNVVLSYEALLQGADVRAAVSNMDMEKLHRVQLSPTCDESFVAFIGKLLSINATKVGHK
ncbi:Cell differentiation family, Rcd1-like containing protein [Tritrichomonas foetus]|uniref:Cell differentiation family, Rcd1-like containing protein n=1 Tax=Tritrichomonas foetus TaxID=1144522 RepID=A0A1J4K0Z0_9EUKA|nr:Cell differentiation family, Rcd1-like containing protein [Tritrichomonas foetus]|eukprot:OHT05047.1 Cell differentiation family, Rcd1-like containing protein [Tritrichomonas foetus]